MNYTVDNIVEEALMVIKKEPQRKIVIYRNNISTTDVEDVLSKLGINYEVVKSRTEFERYNPDKSYTIDLSILPLEERTPDLERLRTYWKS